MKKRRRKNLNEEDEGLELHEQNKFKLWGGQTTDKPQSSFLLLLLFLCVAVAQPWGWGSWDHIPNWVQRLLLPTALENFHQEAFIQESGCLIPSIWPFKPKAGLSRYCAKCHNHSLKVLNATSSRFYLLRYQDKYRSNCSGDIRRIPAYKG